MKLLLLVCLIGFASASPLYEEDVEKAKQPDFMLDQEEDLAVKEAVGLAENYVFADEESHLYQHNLKDLFKKLKKDLLEENDKEKLMATIEQLFGKGTEMTNALEVFVDNKGKEDLQVLLDLIDRFTGEEEPQTVYEQKGFKKWRKKIWKKIKKVFKDVKDISKKLTKFTKLGNWIKQIFKKGFDEHISKLENIKNIARQIIKNPRGITKDVAREALDFLKEYKKDLGNLFDQVRDVVRIIQTRKD